MVKVWSTVRISEGLLNSCKDFVKTKKAKKLGLITVKDVMEYYARKGMEGEL